MDLQSVTRTLGKLTSALDKTVILPARASCLRSFLSAVSIFFSNDKELFVAQRLSVSKSHTLYIEDNAEFLSQASNRLRELQAFVLSFVTDNDKTSSVESARKSRELFNDELKLHLLRRSWVLFNVETISAELDRLVLDFYDFLVANVPLKGLHSSFKHTFEQFSANYKALTSSAIDDAEALKNERLFCIEGLVALFPDNKVYSKFNQALQAAPKKTSNDDTDLSTQQLEEIDATLETELKTETRQLLESLETEILQNLHVDVYDLKHLSFINESKPKRTLRKTSNGNYNNSVLNKHFQLAQLKSGSVNKTVIARYVQSRNNQRHANKVSDLFSFLREVDVLKKSHEHVLSPVGYSFLPNSAFGSLCFLYDFNKPNTTLEELTQNNYKFNDVEILTVAVSVSKALDFLHSHGVFHGKISPANVWLCVENSSVPNADENTERAIVKLSDFDTDLRAKKNSLQGYENDVRLFGSLLSQLSDVKPAMQLDNFVLDARFRKSLNDIIEQCLSAEPHQRPSSLSVKTKLEELLKIFKVDTKHMSEVVLGLIENKRKGVNEEYAQKFKQRQKEARQNRRSFRDVFRTSKVYALENEAPTVSEKKVSFEAVGDKNNADNSAANRKSANFMKNLRNAFRLNYKKKSSQISMDSKLSSHKDESESYNYRPKPKESMHRLRSQNFADDELEFKKSVSNDDFKKNLDVFENLAVESVSVDDDAESLSSKQSDMAQDYKNIFEGRTSEQVKLSAVDRIAKKKSEVIHSDDIIINTLFLEPVTKLPMLSCLTGDVLTADNFDDFEEWEDNPRKRSNAILRLSKAMKNNTN